MVTGRKRLRAQGGKANGQFSYTFGPACASRLRLRFANTRSPKPTPDHTALCGPLALVFLVAPPSGRLALVRKRPRTSSRRLKATFRFRVLPALFSPYPPRGDARLRPAKGRVGCRLFANGREQTALFLVAGRVQCPLLGLLDLMLLNLSRCDLPCPSVL